MSRSPSELHPDLLPVYLEFKERCDKAGLDFILTCTYRSNKEQAELYAQGRTKSGRIVTRAKPGESKHNFTVDGNPASKAFDIVPLRHGKPVWGTSGNGIDNDSADDDIDDLELWQRFGKIGSDLGLNWYGRTDAPFREMPHFEIR